MVKVEKPFVQFIGGVELLFYVDWSHTMVELIYYPSDTPFLEWDGDPSNWSNRAIFFNNCYPKRQYVPKNWSPWEKGVANRFIEAFERVFLTEWIISKRYFAEFGEMKLITEDKPFLELGNDQLRRRWPSYNHLVNSYHELALILKKHNCLIIEDFDTWFDFRQTDEEEDAFLTVELVPETCWFSNMRDHVDKAAWDTLRRQTYRKADYICQICGGRGPEWPVECHEVWDYDDINHVQTLTDLIALCPSCHQVKHIGLASLRGNGEAAKAHLAKVNDWTLERTSQYLEHVWHVWEERSQHQWELDLIFLDQFNIKLKLK
jgi:hypothetical protein